MWLVPTAIYWSSLGLVLYTYGGYPLLINLLARLRGQGVRSASIEPTISVVLAAHNEGPRLAAKLENLLALSYPKEKLQVVVVSDGSNDETDAVLAKYRARGVVALRLERRMGKAAALNRGVQRASGEVVVFCDARQMIDAGALRAIVPLFADPQVGAVSGELTIAGQRGPGVYWAYEKLIRAAEGKVDSVVGATGALFAIRRHLFTEIPHGTLLDDLFTPMQIVMQGYRVLFQPEARVYDEEATVGAEFSRKARTLAGNFQLLSIMPELLDPRKNRIFPQFVSHKLLRLACPAALVTLLGANIALVATGAPGWPFYVASLGGQLAAYGMAAYAALKGERAGRLARISHTFVVLNAAAVEGLRRYLKGDFTWTGTGTCPA